MSELEAIRQRTEEDRMALNGMGWIGDDTCVGDKEKLLAAIDAVEALIKNPLTSADKRHYEDDFNRGHCTGYNAAATLLCKAIGEALGDAE